MTGLNGMLDGLVINRTAHVRIYEELQPSKEQPIEEALPGSMHVIESIKPKNTPLRVRNALAIMNSLKDDPRVMGVSPQTKAQVFYLAGSTQLNGLIHGVDIMEETRLYHMNDYILEGKPEDLANTTNGIILGKGVADKMSVKIGDRIQIMSPIGTIVPLKVVAFYQSGLSELDNVNSYANISLAQKLLGKGKSYITDLQVKLNDIEESPAFAAEVRKIYGAKAIDIQTANAQFDTGTSIRNLITYAVSITLLIVAGFGIYNILNMLIYEKMNDIAILKATGFSGGDVRNIFITQAVIIGMVGGALGLIIGYGLSVLIDHTPFETEALPTIKTYPVNFNPLYYIIGIVFAMVTTFFAGFLPARRASSIDPVEIIRGQ
jgi:lipoprotein-releasing system permease protein